jgi:hypothetical protein
MRGKFRLQQTFRPSSTAVKILSTKYIEIFEGFHKGFQFFFSQSAHQSTCIIGCSNSDYFPKQR